MKSNELREGSWIQRIRSGTPILVTPDHIKSIAEGDTDYSPIPLTPEILEKSGFGIKEPQGVFAWKFAPAGQYINVKCESVHQLQNLIFALTGEDLKIEL